MFYVDVVLASTRVKLNRALTYASDKDLDVGQIVRVPLAKRTLTGVIVKTNTKKVKNIKPISSIIDGYTLTPKQIEFAYRLAEFYATPIEDVISLLLPAGIHKKRRTKLKQEFGKITLPNQPTNDQQAALKTIVNTDPAQTIVLHGATGSGKTYVYHELVKQVVKQNKGAILLVPEISLTTQFVQYFYSYFKGVFVVHSHLSEAERHLLWQCVHNAKAPIVIGPRSALFMPVKQLGLVVIDEFHDPAYKQENSPKYQTSRAARILANQSKAKLVLGSATPNIEDLFIAKNKTSPIISMRSVGEDKHNVILNVVDITTSKLQSGVFSEESLKAIRTTLSNNKQVLVFHNRRGTSTSVVCSHCGHVEVCPNCDLPLTHHHDKSELVCHICNYSDSLPMSCRECSSPDYIYKGFGTKEIEAQLSKLFPSARVARFDGDNKADERLEKRYEEIQGGYIDIIVGTQVVAKGLDLPKLETVVIPSLDSLLYIPDYSTNQKLYQLIYQVIGRIGRHSDGYVVAQTFNSSNPILSMAVDRKYDEFYQQELEWRKQTEYPPYSFLLLLNYRAKQRSTAQNKATELVNSLSKLQGIKVLGPSPAFHEKQPSGYSWQIVVKSQDRNKLTNIAKQLPAGWNYDIDPVSLL